MSRGDLVPLLPADAPQAGEVYRHYKGDLYIVFDLALNSDDEWMVIYQAHYKNPAAKYFTRPLREWREIVEWEGHKIPRFVKIEE
jgi:hypothetical protein